jgi:4-carboxymuconolactone decarboxylase
VTRQRPSTPRIAPRPESDWDDEAREQLTRAMGGAIDGEGRSPLNIFRTLVNHPKMLKYWMVFAGGILNKGELPARDREILILRAGWNCHSVYEWGQHTAIGRRVGLTDAEIARIADGPDAPGWDPFDATLLRAADELHADACISDATWDELRVRYGTKQLIEVPMTVGQYYLVSMTLNSLGVQREPGVDGFPGDPPAS